MSSIHETISWTAGDDWQIFATLLDETGAPFDLSGSPVILWALMNSAFLRALDENDVHVAVIDPLAGLCSITVAAAKTSPLPGGRYTDVIRLVLGGITSTLSYGTIYVAADPWLAAEVVTQTQQITYYAKPRLVA